MAIRHKRSETYTRFVFDPEDIGDPYYLVAKKRIELLDVDAVIEAHEAGKEVQITRDIKKGARRINITYRVLTGRDMADLTDEAARRGAGEDNPQAGTSRIDAVRKAVVSWDIEEEEPWNEELLNEIDDTLLDQIYFWVRKNGVPPEQDEVSGLPLEKPEPVSRRSPRSPQDRKPAVRKASSRNTRTSRADTP